VNATDSGLVAIEESRAQGYLDEIKMLRSLLSDVLPFINDVMIRNTVEMLRYKRARSRAQLAVKTRAYRLKEDAPQLWDEANDRS